MSNNSVDDDTIDWSLTTWDGAEREKMRRWAALPLEQIIQAIEEMGKFAEFVSPSSSTSFLREEPGQYDTGTNTKTPKTPD